MEVIFWVCIFLFISCREIYSKMWQKEGGKEAGQKDTGQESEQARGDESVV
jgi:hypothetical protein